MLRTVRNKKIPIDGFDGEELARLETAARTGDNFTLNRLFVYLSDVCNTTEKPVLLIIDEVDSATNNQVFLDFLAQLRGYYLERDSLPTFQPVILAGAYDIKSIEMKIRPETAHKVNSPWNIASDFPINMSFNADEIKGMLLQYEENHKT